MSADRSVTLTSEMWLPRPVEEVFDFFAEPCNLEALTPEWLHFRILTPGPIRMGPGTTIDYRLALHGVPLRWQAEIREWDPPHRFVDVQKRGPYRHWVHEHRFEPSGGGTLVLDRVDYWPRGGRLAQWLLVGRDVERVFAYRRCVLSHYFEPARPEPGSRDLRAQL